ncbi:MAG: helix-turn-helix transcriptional regulator [Bacillota bacterium]
MTDPHCKKKKKCHFHHPGQGCILHGFLQPTLLLLLLEKPAHGYELAGRLSDFGLEDSDPGGIYRNLQKLEGDGFIQSNWDTSGRGPARKVYQVTSEGRQFLDSWVRTLTSNRDLLQSFIVRYEKVNQSASE